MQADTEAGADMNWIKQHERELQARERAEAELAAARKREHAERVQTGAGKRLLDAWGSEVESRLRELAVHAWGPERRWFTTKWALRSDLGTEDVTWWVRKEWKRSVMGGDDHWIAYNHEAFGVRAYAAPDGDFFCIPENGVSAASYRDKELYRLREPATPRGLHTVLCALLEGGQFRSTER
jgi:hypothetical protein